jgi:hypothetical protein
MASDASGSGREPSDEACGSSTKLHGGVLRATPIASNDDRQYHGDLSEDHACDIRSGRSAKVEKHLSAPLGVKNRFAQ